MTRPMRRLLFVASLACAVVGVASLGGCDKAEMNKALGRYRAYDPKASGKEQKIRFASTLFDWLKAN